PRMNKFRIIHIGFLFALLRHTVMKNVVLFFPDADKMVKFLISCQISQAEANTNEGSLIALLEEDDILQQLQILMRI
ncbi:MAG TPA: hypothetical protein VL095_02690, partial [Flavisolibacter sp.]|nr:hypothetical protein [Flavisolibacter sp.]